MSKPRPGNPVAVKSSGPKPIDMAPLRLLQQRVRTAREQVGELRAIITSHEERELGILVQHARDINELEATVQAIAKERGVDLSTHVLDFDLGSFKLRT
jgi:hypothetical protein